MTDPSLAPSWLPSTPGLMSDTGVDRPLVMKFGGSLVEQLGAQLYPSVTATVAELISNAWDADAKNVWIKIPFDADWSSSDAEIVVLDDGHGMTRAAAQATYLIVGRKKRLGPHGDKSENGRPVHGRKGIGKLAAFGTASYLECTTLRDSEMTAFGLDYDELRRLNPDQNYYVDPVKTPSPLIDPAGNPLSSGTRVKLTGLRVKRKISQATFITSMSRRFALNDMKVWINGQPLQRFSIPLEYRLPRDYNPENLEINSDGWAVEKLPSGDEISWWIGFTAKPLSESDQQGISILARDKMAQRPFKFERSQGTTAQLGLEYLVGEVKADWIDSGDDIDTDYIQSNRDQLQLEDSRLDEFLSWGRRRLAWSLRARQDLRSRSAQESIESDERITSLLRDIAAPERRALTAVARRLSKIPEVDSSQLADVMQAVVSAREDSRMREISSRISDSSPTDSDEFWKHIDEAMDLDSRRLAAVLEARIAALNKIQPVIASPVSLASISSRVYSDPWMLDARLTTHSTTKRATDLVPRSPRGAFILESVREGTVDEITLVWAHNSELNTEQVQLFSQLIEEIAAQFLDTPVNSMLVAPRFKSPGQLGQIRSSSGVQRRLLWADAISQSVAQHQAWLARTRRRSAEAEK